MATGNMKRAPLVLGIGAGVALVVAVMRYAIPPQEGGGGGALRLRLIQVGGPRARLPRAIASPQPLVEGSVYQAQAGVTNTSTRAGLPVAADLSIAFSGAAGPLTLISQTARQHFGAGQSLNVASQNIAIPVPLPTPGTGQVSATLLDPNGGAIATATLPIVTQVAPVVYSGTISLGSGAGAPAPSAPPGAPSPKFAVGQNVRWNGLPFVIAAATYFSVSAGVLDPVVGVYAPPGAPGWFYQLVGQGSSYFTEASLTAA